MATSKRELLLICGIPAMGKTSAFERITKFRRFVELDLQCAANSGRGKYPENDVDPLQFPLQRQREGMDGEV